jgi:hypothetical protein
MIRGICKVTWTVAIQRDLYLSMKWIQRDSHTLLSMSITTLLLSLPPGITSIAYYTMINLSTWTDAEALSCKNSMARIGILSHKWYTKNNDEVSYKDLETGSVEEKAGRLLFARSKCLFDGLGHIWMDICCVNSRSEVELSNL